MVVAAARHNRGGSASSGSSGTRRTGQVGITGLRAPVRALHGTLRAYACRPVSWRLRFVVLPRVRSLYSLGAMGVSCPVSGPARHIVSSRPVPALCGRHVACALPRFPRHALAARGARAPGFRVCSRCARVTVVAGGSAASVFVGGRGLRGSATVGGITFKGCVQARLVVATMRGLTTGPLATLGWRG